MNKIVAYWLWFSYKACLKFLWKRLEPERGGPNPYCDAKKKKKKVTRCVRFSNQFCVQLWLLLTFSGNPLFDLVNLLLKCGRGLGTLNDLLHSIIFLRIHYLMRPVISLRAPTNFTSNFTTVNVIVCDWWIIKVRLIVVQYKGNILLKAQIVWNTIACLDLQF